MNIQEFETGLRSQNDLRRQAQLPLLNVDQELEKFRGDEAERAYSNFLGAQVRPHTQHLRDVKPKGWSEAQGLYGRHLRIKERLRPEVDRRWAEIVRNGSWRAWIEE